MNRIHHVALALLLASLVGIATAQGLEREHTVVMDEMYFQLDGQERNAPIVLEAGVPYRITFVNQGAVTHRVKFGRGVTTEEGVPYGYAEDLFSGVFARVVGTRGEAQFAVDSRELLELDVEPGGEVVMTFTLPNARRGEWEIGCFVPATQDTPNHYVAGMLAPLMIE